MAGVLVTALEKRPRSRRIVVKLEGDPGLTVTPDIALQFGLRRGVVLAPSRLEALRDAQAREDAMASGLRLVAYRPRSEKEMRDRLRQRGVAANLIESTIQRLKELRLLDDSAFAISWVEARDHGSPRSRRMLRAELQAKGVSRITADAAGDVDEADAAYRAASKRARNLAGRPFAEFRRKVGDLLLRRGFSYEIAAETVDRLWRETAGTTTTDVAADL